MVGKEDEKLGIALLGCPGLEPGTNRLKVEYSTIELATQSKEKKKVFIRNKYNKFLKVLNNSF